MKIARISVAAAMAIIALLLIASQVFDGVECREANVNDLGYVTDVSSCD